jgi:5-methyltetrahydropteroyltriglutamate--homocysteine methyltransferase
MYVIGPPFHAEHVGSLLRPRRLKNAFAAYRANEITPAELEETIDDCVAEAIRLQEECGMRAITDGEFRRGSWFLGFVEAVDGLTTRPASLSFSGDHAAWSCPHAEGKVKRNQSIALHEFEFVKENTARMPKVTMPSPSAAHFLGAADKAGEGAYSDLDALFEDLALVYQQEIEALDHAGCEFLQLDEVPLAMLCDPKVQEGVRAKGEDPDALVGRYIDAINMALKDRPEDMTVGLHLCRGNYKGQWMAEGGYAPVAEKLFREANVDAFFLEYDSERAGDFSPLAAMPEDKVVVLGLVSSKTPELEDPDDLKRRIEAASEYVSMDRLALSPQCGFASSVGGNPVTEDDERRKLTLVADVAADVWS